MSDVKEIEQRSWAVTGRAASNVVAAGVAALAATHGVDVPAAVAVAGLSGSLSEEAVAKLASIRLQRLQRFADTSEVESGVSLDELVADALGEPRKLELLWVASEAASRASDDWKIDMLARTFVYGIQNDDTVDAATVIVDVRQLSRCISR